MDKVWRPRIRLWNRNQPSSPGLWLAGETTSWGEQLTGIGSHFTEEIELDTCLGNKLSPLGIERAERMRAFLIKLGTFSWIFNCERGNLQFFLKGCFLLRWWAQMGPFSIPILAASNRISWSSLTWPTNLFNFLWRLSWGSYLFSTLSSSMVNNHHTNNTPQQMLSEFWLFGFERNFKSNATKTYSQRTALW